jgi:hypothetical protein
MIEASDTSEQSVQIYRVISLTTLIVTRYLLFHGLCGRSQLRINDYIYTGCPRRNVPDFGRVFLVLKYTDITQSTYTQS